MIEPNNPIEPNTIVVADCIKLLGGLSEGVADLIFADPPFNIGYQYDIYDDRKAYNDYYAWTEQWMGACANALKPDGSLWIAIGDDYAAEVRIIARKLGLHLRNWVIWHYTFGQQTKAKFARAHTHLFYWVKDATTFTFNDMAVRVPSARQTTYADKRANPKGKLPDDVWTFSRVCGTFGERVKWHPCQMPEKLLERIIKASSNPGDLVIDPFSGSGTTCCVAAQLGRQYFGTDISETYVRESNQRIADTLAGKRARTVISDNPEAIRAKVRLKQKPKAFAVAPEMDATGATGQDAPKRRGRPPGSKNKPKQPQPASEN